MSSPARRRWIKVVVGVVLLAYFAMCTLAKFDGGATKGMPSRSAAAAERSGMLVRQVDLVVEPGGPSGLSDAWIERGAYTTYRFGAFPTRRPLHGFDGSEMYLLVIAHPSSVFLTVEARRNEGRTALLTGGQEVTGWPVEAPFPDTVVVRAARPPSDVFYRVDWRGP